MPTPAPYERRDKILERCIPMLIDEGKPPDQAAAICNSMFEDKRKMKMGINPESAAKIFYDIYARLEPEYLPTSGPVAAFDEESPEWQLLMAAMGEFLSLLYSEEAGMEDDAAEESKADMLSFFLD